MHTGHLQREPMSESHRRWCAKVLEGFTTSYSEDL